MVDNIWIFLVLLLCPICRSTNNTLDLSTCIGVNSFVSTDTFSCHNVLLISAWIPMKSNLTHWGRVTHICVGKLIIIGSDNGLSPDRRQAIIWTNAELLSIGPWPTYFSENLIKMQQFSLKKMHVKMSSAKWRLSCLGLNVLIKDGNFQRGCVSESTRTMTGLAAGIPFIILDSPSP